MDEDSAESSPEPLEPETQALERELSEHPESAPQPAASVETVSRQPAERPRFSSARDVASQAPARIPAYQVAARMLAQGVLSGLAGGVPVVSFLFLAMALDGVGTPGVLEFVAVYLSCAAMISAWGAALTAVEEFARRANRSVGRMVMASLGFPLFAVVAMAWIGGVLKSGPGGGLQTVRMMVEVVWDEFRRQPVASLANTTALLIPFLGLLLVRRRREADERSLSVAQHYLASGALGLVSAACVLVANLFWGTTLKPSIVLLGFALLGTLLMMATWGLAGGRAVADHYVKRYQRWAYAD